MLVTFRAAVVAGALGLLLLAAAVGVAAARFDACGPSALDAADAACRHGLQLLVAAYVVLSAALVLGAASLTLLWRERRRHRDACGRTGPLS
ncbi:MAG TPA: hypothetical protein VIG88_07135 [Lysobacter sp.]